MNHYHNPQQPFKDVQQFNNMAPSYQRYVPYQFSREENVGEQSQVAHCVLVVNPPQASLKPDTRARNLSALATTATPLVDHGTTEKKTSSAVHNSSLSKANTCDLSFLLPELPSDSDNEDMLVEDSQKGEAETEGHGKNKGKARQPNFGNQEISKLLKLVGEYVPIGGKGWERVALLYNVWAEKGGFKSRDHRSLRDKYNRLLKEALSKPSGETERDPTTVFGCVLIINNKMEKKANEKTLDDDNSDVSPIEVNNHVDGGTLSQDVIELSDSDNNLPLPPTYKVETPLKDKRAAARCEKVKLELLMEYSQSQSMYDEVRDLQTCRADKAEFRALQAENELQIHSRSQSRGR
ncbi:hypothetical protein BDQ17DRAFT_1348745, partial [Cyathus striatus]